MRLSISAEQTQESELVSLSHQLVALKPEPELISLIKHIISRFRSMNWKPKQLISLRPQVLVTLEQGKFRVTRKEVRHMESKKEECSLWSVQFWRSTGKDHFYCRDCDGQYHEEYDKAPLEVKYSLHPIHSLKLVLFTNEFGIMFTNEYGSRSMVCYCCDEYLEDIFYYCPACDLAMNRGCVVKQPVLSVDYSNWHQHPLAAYAGQTPLTCNLCAMDDFSSPMYMCPPCGFVVHRRCLDLPRVIRISRHHHRITFTSAYVQGDWYCDLCSKKMDNDNGGYSCIRDGCSYAAHSRCAIKSNVWDGIELEGIPEETEEEFEPYVTISPGIIQHFSHLNHHLKLDDNTDRDYDDHKQCQACIMPIYSGNFYSCVQCDFILHEDCAKLRRKIYHPVHPHILSLVREYEGAIKYYDECSACGLVCISGCFYACGKEGCYRFKLHVQCATLSEPLVHGSHLHPLFLTSKPGERRRCDVCKESRFSSTNETFNCTECEFALCFACATIPQRVRYTDDKHMLTLCYGKETSTKTLWCEECEQKINPEERFYKCDEYCCVTIHMECLIGKDLYMKPGLLFRDNDTGIDIKVMSNNHHIARPFCSNCKKRCPQKVVYERSGLVFCSLSCVGIAKPN